MPDYHSIVRSSIFSFLVGEDKTRLKIHAGAVQCLSKPLSALINNGQMKESASRTATLSDVEVDTFIGFCEYAYTGRYTTLNRGIHEEEAAKPSSIAKKDRTACGASDKNINEEAIGASSGWDSLAGAQHRQNKRKGVGLWSPEREARHLEQISIININYPYKRLWYEFKDRSFNGEGASVANHPDLLFHARLYVFATRFLVESLRAQCLISLHRDLCEFLLTRTSTPLILDLLEYTYSHTGKKEPGGGSPLRELVIHYVACEAQILFDHGDLKPLLDKNGEMGSDLVAKLVE